MNERLWRALCLWILLPLMVVGLYVMCYLDVSDY